MRILLIGYGRMGRLVAALAPEYGCEVAGTVDSRSASGADGLESPRWNDVDVAIDFSSPSAVVTTAQLLAARRINLVVGTTGWRSDEAAVRAAVDRAGIGIVAAPNFSTGVVLLDAIVGNAAALFRDRSEF